MNHIKLHIACFLLICSFYKVSAQSDNGPDICLGISPTSGLIIGKQEKLQGGVFGISAGLYSIRRYPAFRLLAGIQFHKRAIDNYSNHVTYTSNWVNGPEKSRVRLSTDISQFFLELPVMMEFDLGHSVSGIIGAQASFLLQSVLNQEAKGYYRISRYPDEGWILTETIKYVYRISDDRNTATFPKFNLAPCLGLGYVFSNSVNIRGTVGYELFSNPAIDIRFNKYNLINAQLLLTLKMK